MFTEIKNWLVNHKPTKRRIIQVYAALLFNANLKGFKTGVIYQGPLKNLCTPGLNCYSCPGASGACPLGALQNALAACNARLPYYVFGILLLYGLFFGRWICGFLCPFGLIQDLLHKIKTPKLKKGRFTRTLSHLKYVILFFLVVIVPLLYAFRDFPLPGFCKYICPAGTLGGAIGLLMNAANSELFGMLGPLFTWKFLLLVAFIVGAVFIYRFFCRFFCPLGAIYGLFNRIAFIGVKLDKTACTDCGLCKSACKMDIRQVGDRECINCGECLNVCPTKAISWKGSKIFLAPNAVSPVGSAPSPEEELTQIGEQKKARRRRLVVQIAAWAVALAVLAGALVYYNCIDGKDAPIAAEGGYEVGNLCYPADITVLDADGNSVFNIESDGSRVTVINFWGTWCSPCVAELPHFDSVAEEYGEDVTVIAIHSEFAKETALAYMQEKFPNTSMLCGVDAGDLYYAALGGVGTYPMTLVLDENDVVVARYVGSVTHEQLTEAIESALD